MNSSEIIKAGYFLFNAGLVTFASGNLSIRLGDRLLITRTGCELGNLVEKDVIETGIFSDDANTKLASSELAVHREIYKVTDVKAIAHAHPLHSTALTMKVKEIEPVSPEVRELTGTVPVIGWGMEIKPGSCADLIAEALRNHRIIMLHGHGSFAGAETLEEACRYTVLFEEDCRIHRPAKPEEMVHFG